MSDASAEPDAADEPADDAAVVRVPLRYDVPVTQSAGQVVLHPSRDEIVGVAEALLTDGFVMCIDVCGVDYLSYESDRDLPHGIAAERFEVVYSFMSHASGERVRCRVQVPEADANVPTLFGVYPGTEAMEREVFDLFGIGFTDHPDMTRILMPEDWRGHPLRKDFAVGQIPVQFKGAPS